MSIFQDIVLGAMGQRGPRNPPWQMEPTEQDLALDEGGDINRLLAHVAALRSGGQMPSGGEYLGAPRSPGAMGGGIGGNAPMDYSSLSQSPARGPGAAGSPAMGLAPLEVGAMSIDEIVKAAQAAGELPIEFYRNRVPPEKRSKGVVHTLSYGMPTPSNGETREMAMERAQRMQGGYVNGQPIPQGPEADAIRERFRNPTGPANPQTAADLAAIDARTQNYAQQIRGHGGSSDFNPAGAYGQAERSMGAGLPEERRAQAQRLAMMPPSERALLASSPGPEPFRGGAPSATLMGMLGGGGAAGPSGPSGPAMAPEEAMRRLSGRTGGAVVEGMGHMPAWLADEAAKRVAAGEATSAVMSDIARKANTGRGKVSGISPEYAKKLEDREQRAKDRGIARGMQRSGVIPPDIMQDQMALNFIQKNPQVVSELIRQHGNQMNPEMLLKMMEMTQNQEEAKGRNELGNRALQVQQYEALIGAGVPEEDAYARVYGASPDAVMAPGGARRTTPREAGLEFTAGEGESLAGLGQNRQAIVDYGRTQGWSDAKITRALQKYGGSNWATPGDPDGTLNWLASGFGRTPIQPGFEPEFSFSSLFYGQPERGRSSGRRR